MFSLDISAVTGKAHVAYLRRYLMRARALLKVPLREMSVALVGDRKMAELHERFMGIAGPTDVLTFELEHDAKGRVVAGEVVVCVPYAVREGTRRGVGVRKELLLYALHGMLHLCGLDDRNEIDFAHMHHREDEILKRLGVGAVFHFAGEKPGKGSGSRKTCPRPPGRILARGGSVGAGEGTAPGVAPGRVRDRRHAHARGGATMVSGLIGAGEGMAPLGETALTPALSRGTGRGSQRELSGAKLLATNATGKRVRLPMPPNRRRGGR
jgi:rRNA maturation RNase YbeY